MSPTPVTHLHEAIRFCESESIFAFSGDPFAQF
jgi:hypothetical protein